MEHSLPCLGGHPFRRSSLMRRANVRERGEQVIVRPYFIFRHLSICKNGQKEIDNVVGERSAIVRVGRRPRGIIVEDVRQHGPGDPRCFRRRISSSVFQRMREDGDEAAIVRWLRSQIRRVLLARKEGSLIGPRPALRLHPFPACAVQRTSPQTHLLRTEGRVGHFEHNAAHVLVGEVIVTGELQVIQGAIYVEEKGIAAPAREESAASSLCHLRFQSRRDRCSFDDRVPFVACPGGLLPSTRRTVAVCAPFLSDEKRTRYAISAIASPFVSIFSSYTAWVAKGSSVVGP